MLFCYFSLASSPRPAAYVAHTVGHARHQTTMGCSPVRCRWHAGADRDWSTAFRAGPRRGAERGESRHHQCREYERMVGTRHRSLCGWLVVLFRPPGCVERSNHEIMDVLLGNLYRSYRRDGNERHCSTGLGPSPAAVFQVHFSVPPGQATLSLRATSCQEFPLIEQLIRCQNSAEATCSRTRITSNKRSKTNIQGKTDDWVQRTRATSIL